MSVKRESTVKKNGWIRIGLLTAETKEGREDGRREGVVDERTTGEAPSLQYIITCTYHMNILHTLKVMPK